MPAASPASWPRHPATAFRYQASAVHFAFHPSAAHAVLPPWSQISAVQRRSRRSARVSADAVNRGVHQSLRRCRLPHKQPALRPRSRLAETEIPAHRFSVPDRACPSYREESQYRCRGTWTSVVRAPACHRRSLPRRYPPALRQRQPGE